MPHSRSYKFLPPSLPPLPTYLIILPRRILVAHRRKPLLPRRFHEVVQICTQRGPRHAVVPSIFPLYLPLRMNGGGSGSGRSRSSRRAGPRGYHCVPHPN